MKRGLRKVAKVKVKVLCPKCEGNGKIIMQKYPIGKGSARVVCPECKGHGWIEAEFIEDTGGEVFFS
jgi:DnaJ-class molecular chaperone